MTRDALQILRDIRNAEDLQDLQAIVNGDVFFEALMNLSRLTDAAQTMLDDPSSLNIVSNRKRLRAALAEVKGNHA